GGPPRANASRSCSRATPDPRFGRLHAPLDHDAVETVSARDEPPAGDVERVDAAVAVAVDHAHACARHEAAALPPPEARTGAAAAHLADARGRARRERPQRNEGTPLEAAPAVGDRVAVRIL